MVERDRERVGKRPKTKEGRMEGYDVVTTEDEKLGHVVGTHGEHLIVEQGLLRKSKHALPREFAAIDDTERVVRISVTKDVFCNSPKVDDGEVDERAIAEYYGLSYATAPDPPGHAEEDATRGDVPTAPEERVRVREDEGAGLPGESPALLGDRLAGVDEREQQER
jgi:hypothetical protein